MATRSRHGTWGGRFEFADRRQPCRLLPLLCFAAPDKIQHQQSRAVLDTFINPLHS